VGPVALPFTPADRAAGYWWDVSMRQVEVSRTLVFDRPRRARAFFEALPADNLDLGRPEQMQVVFGRRVRTDPDGGYRTRLLRAGDQVTLNAHFRRSRVKVYLKEGRALRVETVVNDTGDLGVARRLEHLDEVSSRGRDVNRRMVDNLRVGQGAVLASPAFERAARPTVEDGRRAPALRFGDLGSWPWAAPCAPASTPSAASPTGACGPTSPPCWNRTTPRRK
jgi:hypothetical protein